MKEQGWVIERHFAGELRYWTGHSTDRTAFCPSHDEAIRFAREQDALAILVRLLGGDGRVAEHIWTPLICE